MARPTASPATQPRQRRGPLLIRSDPELEGSTAPGGRRVRPALLSDAAIQVCLALKRLFGLALRQTTGLGMSLLRLTKLASALDHATGHAFHDANGMVASGSVPLACLDADQRLGA
jgi:hypothetical protein